MNEFESQYQDIIGKLNTLKGVKASDRLKSRIQLVATSLPKQSHLPFNPFMRLALSVIVVCLLLGSTISVAAATSKPGDTLYPVKQAMEKIAETIKQSPALRILLRTDNQEVPTDNQTQQENTTTPTPTLKAQTKMPTPSPQIDIIITIPNISTQGVIPTTIAQPTAIPSSNPQISLPVTIPSGVLPQTNVVVTPTASQKASENVSIDGQVKIGGENPSLNITINSGLGL